VTDKPKPKPEMVPKMGPTVFGPHVNLILCRNPHAVIQAHGLMDDFLYAKGRDLLASRLLPISFGVGARRGLIHQWLDHIADLGGQWWLTTVDSPAIDCLGFTSAQDVYEHLHVFEGGTVRNISEREAGNFYSAYDVGIQYVSEILRSEGIL
jgi:hypothetical protein